MSYTPIDRKYCESSYIRKYNNVYTSIHSLSIEDIEDVLHLNKILVNSPKKLKAHRFNLALYRLAEQIVKEDPRYENMTHLLESLLYGYVSSKIESKKAMKPEKPRIVEIETKKVANDGEKRESYSFPKMLEEIYCNLKANNNVIHNPEKNIPILIKITKEYVGKDKRAKELLQLLENLSSKGEKQ